MIPGIIQNIECLGIEAVGSELDNRNKNNIQSFYFILKDTLVDSFYVRIFDPSVENDIDLKKSNTNTKVEYAVYGENGAFWDGSLDNIGSSSNGKELSKITFDTSQFYYQEWFTMCKLSIRQGEYNEKMAGYIFKFNCKILSGKGTNYYRIFISNSAEENINLKKSNIFTYELTFKLSPDITEVSHIFPYIDGQYKNVDFFIKGYNNRGYVRIVSNSRRGFLGTISETDYWSNFSIRMLDQETLSTLGVQFIKARSEIIDNRLVTINMISDSTKYLPIFSDPIGGIPRITYKVYKME